MLGQGAGLPLPLSSHVQQAPDVPIMENSVRASSLPQALPSGSWASAALGRNHDAHV